MNSLEKQVKDLSTKVDALHQAIEQLSHGIIESLPTNPRSPLENDSFRLKVGTNHYQYQRYNGLSDSSMEHKDVLVDESNLDTTFKSGTRPIAPEIQIQRLTAQLTAAYNRIAALEEQLLAQRTH